MKFLLIIILCNILCFITSCNDSKTLIKIQQASKIIEDNPLQAYHLLKTVEKEVPTYPEELQMRWGFLLSKAQYKAFIPFTSDSLMKKVVIYYDSNGSSNEKMECYYLLGGIYRDLNNIPKALEAYHIALTKANITDNKCNFRVLGRIYGQMEESFIDQESPLNAISVGQESIHYGHLANAPIDSIDAYRLLAEAYKILGIEDSVYSISKKAHRMFLQQGNYYRAALSLYQLVSLLTKRKQLKEAEVALQFIEKYGGFVRPDKTIIPGPTHASYYTVKGNYLLAVGKPDSAILFFRREIEVNDPAAGHWTYKEGGYKGLFHAYKQKGDKDSTIKYAELWNETIIKEGRELFTKQLQTAQAQYDYSHYKEQAMQERIKRQRIRAELWCTVALLILISAGGYIYLLQRKKREEKKWKELNWKYKCDLKELEEKRQRLLTAEAHYGMATKRIEQLKEQIQTLENKIAGQQDDAKTPEQWAQEEQLIMQTGIVKKLHDLAAAGMKPSAEDWEKLKTEVRKYMPHFLPALVSLCPVLSEDDIKLCMLIKIRCTHPEMCILLVKAKSSVSSARTRLYRKLFRKKGTPLELDIQLRAL